MNKKTLELAAIDAFASIRKELEIVSKQSQFVLEQYNNLGRDVSWAMDEIRSRLSNLEMPVQNALIAYNKACRQLPLNKIKTD